MQLLAVGLNHTTAPVSLREQLAFAPEHLGSAVMAARNAAGAGGSSGAIIAVPGSAFGRGAAWVLMGR